LLLAVSSGCLIGAQGVGTEVLEAQQLRVTLDGEEPDMSPLRKKYLERQAAVAACIAQARAFSVTMQFEAGSPGAGIAPEELRKRVVPGLLRAGMPIATTSSSDAPKVFPLDIVVSVERVNELLFDYELRVDRLDLRLGPELRLSVVPWISGRGAWSGRTAALEEAAARLGEDLGQYWLDLKKQDPASHRGGACNE
jgi:hypothetical protein